MVQPLLTPEEEIRRQMLTQYLTGKFGSPYDVGVSQSTATAGGLGVPPMGELGYSLTPPEQLFAKLNAPLTPQPAPAPAPVPQAAAPAPAMPPVPAEKTKTSDILAMIEGDKRVNPYTEEARAKIGSEGDLAGNLGLALAGLGSAMGGRHAENYVPAVLHSMQRKKQEALTEFDRKAKEFEDQPMKDPNSQESALRQKAYAEILDKPVETFSKFSAQQLDKAFPMIKEVVDARTKKDMAALRTQLLLAKGTPPTTAQTAVDRAFAQEYVKYQAAGGYADVLNQIQTLDGVLADLKTGKQLTGPMLTMMPEAVRKRLIPASMEAQQAVEQSVQRTLKATLGGQFTQEEGRLFMQRGYDPSLNEKANAKKLERALNQLKTMAAAKQQAIDYYEEHGTLRGYQGKLYTLEKGTGRMIETDKSNFYKMLGVNQQTGSPNAPPTPAPSVTQEIPGWNPDWEDEYQQWKMSQTGGEE